MKLKSIALALVALVTFGCGLHGKPADAMVAHYGTTILKEAAALQRGITQATDAGALPVAASNKMTGYMEIVYTKAGQLSEALKAYHAATSLDLRNAKAAEIQALIAAINGPIGQVLGVSMPPGVADQLSKLVGNVIAAVSAIQLEVAKGLGGPPKVSWRVAPTFAWA